MLFAEIATMCTTTKLPKTKSLARLMNSNKKMYIYHRGPTYALSFCAATKICEIRKSNNRKACGKSKKWRKINKGKKRKDKKITPQKTKCVENGRRWKKRTVSSLWLAAQSVQIDIRLSQLIKTIGRCAIHPVIVWWPFRLHIDCNEPFV